MKAIASLQSFAVYKEQAIADAIAERIKIATSSVRLCFYKFHLHSVAGQKIAKALTVLAAKATKERPIQIRILLNRRGFIAEKLYKPNEEDGLKDLKAIQQRYPHCHLTIHYHKTLALGSYHAKQVIIDPDTANSALFLCSGDIQHANDPERHMYETAVLIQGGNMASVARQEFDALIARESNGTCSHAKINRLLFPSTTEQTANANTTSLQGLYLSSKAHGNPFTNLGMAPFKQVLLAGIEQACSTIHLLTPNLNDPEIIQALACAANRGVLVKLVTGKYHNDKSERYFGGKNLTCINQLSSLISPKNQKYLRVHWAVDPHTGNLVQHGQQHIMHAKFCLIDDQFMYMGSSPLDKQAMQCSREIDTVLPVQPTQARSILEHLFAMPYAMGRDYFVDRIITMLSKEHRRLEGKRDEIAKGKVMVLAQLLGELNRPGYTPAMALIQLEKIRSTLEQRRHNWDWRVPESFKTLQKCLFICKQSQNEVDEEERVLAQKNNTRKESLPQTSEEQGSRSFLNKFSP